MCRGAYLIALVALTLFGGASRADADDYGLAPLPVMDDSADTLPAPPLISSAYIGELAFQPAPVQPAATGQWKHEGRGRGVLKALYVSSAALHVLDIHSTLAAMERGAIEGNPLMVRLMANRGAFFATKAAVAGMSLYAVSRVARHHPVAAIVLSAGINSAYLMIVRSNYQIARR
jgi:hypothetical protein